MSSGNSVEATRERLKARLQPNRPMITISLRMPEDVIENLKEIASMLGFTGYQPLMRSCIGQGLPKTFNTLKALQLQRLTETSASTASPTNKSPPPSSKPA